MFAQTLDNLRTYMHGDGAVLLPEIELLFFAIGILLMDAWVKHKDKYWNPTLALVGTIFSGLTLWMLRAQVIQGSDLTGFHETVIVDSFFLLFAALLLAATALVILLSVNCPAMASVSPARYYALLLFACMGLMLTVAGIDLLVIFLALEAAAMSSYFLGASPGFSKKSHPAAVKFLLSSAFGSAILAYGFSLLYGLSGSTNIGHIGSTLSHRNNLAKVIALSRQGDAPGSQMYQLLQSRLPEAVHWHPFVIQALPIVAFTFVAFGLVVKLRALPVHHSCRKTNSDPPITVVRYLSGAFVVATIALLLRLLLTIFADSQDTWWYVMAVVAMAMLTRGILASLRETNIERILGFSSIAHIGYLLLGFVAANEGALTGMAYYLFTYLFMLTGAFAIVNLVRYKASAGEHLHDLDGLYQRSPTGAFLLAIFMLSLAAIPPTAGFLGRYFIVHALIETKHPVLAWFAGVSALPLAYSYLRVAAHAWRKTQSETAPILFGIPESIALGACLFVSLAAGLYSEPFTRMARYAFGQ
jgi:NADH-quinone oxidoreductase subunit N